MGKYIMALDAGTTSNRCILFDKEGNIVSSIEVIPISNGIELFASEKARLLCLGTPIEDFDLLIACTAVSNNCVLVSENTKHLNRIQGLRIENWVKRQAPRP